jgi:hypothetical protein
MVWNELHSIHLSTYLNCHLFSFPTFASPSAVFFNSFFNFISQPTSSFGFTHDYHDHQEVNVLLDAMTLLQHPLLSTLLVP